MENKKKKNNNSPNLNKSIYLYVLIGLAIIVLNIVNINGTVKNIGYSDFFEWAERGWIQSVTVYNEKIAEITLDSNSVNQVKTFLNDQNITDKTQFRFETGPSEAFNNEVYRINENLLDQDKPKISLDYEEQRDWAQDFLSYLLPIGILVLIFLLFMRRVGGAGGGPGSQIFNIGKSKATLFDQNTKVNVTFADVAGLDEAKEEVMEIVDFLKNPRKYTSLGGKIPKGVLLVGEPGTGKTLMAKAVAGEAEVPFFSISGSDFVEMFVGVGASRVRDLFRQAREKAPCIIFIDEIDAIGRARGRNNIQGGNDERENTLNQLLVEMDGFATDKGVILMAATNRPDVLDSALLRPGRFDRQIGIDLPDKKGRKAIFKVHLENIKVNPDINVDQLAEMTSGFAGAEIANICNEAALVAARRNKTSVDMDDFNHALDRVIGGLEKKNKLIAPEEKKIIAYHEAGHAICGWFLENASPLVKVTIVPRGIGTLGYAQYLPKEEYITRTEALLDRMCMTFGGRAAEFNTFGKISTGAQNDLDQITKMAYSMVSLFGMNQKVGQVSFYGMSNNQLQKPYSELTSSMIDQEVRELANKQYERAKQLLKDKKNELEILANELLKKEVLLKTDVERLIGPRPFAEPVIEEEETTEEQQPVNTNGSVPTNDSSEKEDKGKNPEDTISADTAQ